MPPTNPVAYGQSGPDVTALQNFLIGQGMSIPAGATGYFGDQTKAALAQWQQSVGISSSTPGFGTNFGPLSMQAASQVTSSKAPTASAPTSGGASYANASNVPVGGTGGTAPSTATKTAPTSQPVTSTVSTGTTPPASTTSTAVTGVPYNPAWATHGVTQDMWNQMNATERATIGVAMAGYDLLANKPISSITLQDALSAAQKDPNVIQPFVDAYKLDQQGFNQALDQVKIAASTEQQKLQTQFQNERKQLAESQAAAGTAYSGLRGRAQQELAQSEQGIVTSTRAQLQKSVQDLTTQFESKYGTAATNPAALTFVDPTLASQVGISGLATPGGGGATTIAGQTAGGITGSQANAPGGAEYAAVNKAAASGYQQGFYPATAGA
jgi:hypothetical protein